MRFLAFALQSTSLIGWIGDHWIALLAGLTFLAMVYFVAALVLNLPLPFEKRD